MDERNLTVCRICKKRKYRKSFSDEEASLCKECERSMPFCRVCKRQKHYEDFSEKDRYLCKRCEENLPEWGKGGKWTVSKRLDPICRHCKQRRRKSSFQNPDDRYMCMYCYGWKRCAECGKMVHLQNYPPRIAICRFCKEEPAEVIVEEDFAVRKKGPEKTFICLHCDKSFQAYHAQKRKFCSQSCYREWMKNNPKTYPRRG